MRKDWNTLSSRSLISTSITSMRPSYVVSGPTMSPWPSSVLPKAL